MTLRIDRDALRRHLQAEVVPLVEAAMEKGEEAARSYAPVDTGRLRASIDRTTPAHLEGDEVVGEYGTRVEYAEYVEYGTERGPEQPFLRPSIDAMKGAL